MARILYSDDDNYTAATIKDSVERSGHQMVVVSSPEAACGTLADCAEFDLYLADFDYGFYSDLDGIDAAVEARRIAPGLRVILFSGLERDREMRERGVEIEQMSKGDLLELLELIDAL